MYFHLLLLLPTARFREQHVISVGILAVRMHQHKATESKKTGEQEGRVANIAAYRLNTRRRPTPML